MAQTPKQQHPSLQAEQSTAEEQDQNPTSSIAPGQSGQQTITDQQSTKKVAPLRAVGRFDRSSTQRSSKVLVTYPLATGLKDSAKPLQVAVKLHQPSKVFKTKCQAELKLLLDAIKTDFHEDIKTLHQEELYADLVVKIGDEDLKKPIHKCIIAARAFKFFSALKAFKFSPDSTTEKDIFVYEFQTAINQSTKNTSDDKLRVEDQTELEKAKAREDQLREALEVVNCNLPKNLITPELLLNFFRRLYLDTDLTEEESHLNQVTIGWLKANKPELIKQQPDRKHSPDHRESFRTIQPDFEQLSIADSNSANMSQNEQSSSEMAKSSGQTDNEELVDNSQVASSRADNSEPVSLLTRTETFEMISRGNPAKGTNDDPSSSEGVGKNDDDDDDDKDRSMALSNDVNESESSEPYAPVTRTGLKPKKFTTPVGMKSASKRIPATSSSTKKPADSSTKASPAVVARSGSINAKTAVSPPVTTKRSNEISGANSDSSTATTSTPPIAAARTKVTPSSSTTTTTTTPAKPKQTIITRAHPISLERSQSPATKISGKNFIAANKKLISQMERKIPPPVSPHNDQNANDDSENEVSDASLLALTESLTTDTLAAQVDKFSLISYSKLAEALSRMLIGEILTDTVVLVQHNKQVNAHRCILAARSAYLNDQISKQCLPSLTAETPSAAAAARQLVKIDLTEYSYPVVYFSLMHIYSGIVKVPEDVELEDLTKLSHLLHVGTLRQVCEHNLRMNYCHYFHKPCNVCCIGVLKTLPLAWRYDLTELYSKCLQWIGSHFAQIFCLEEFANLKPNDLIEECYKETLCQLTPDNVIQKTIECQKLLKSLPRVKWTESIICLVGRQLEDFCHYVASNYEKILQSESFLNLGKSCWECEVLEENLLAAMNNLRPDSGCRTLIQLDKIECSMESYLNEPRNVSETFVSLVSKMRKYCERYLLKDAAAVVHCNSWRQMNPALQKRIKDQALLATDFEEPTKHLASKPKLPSMARHQQQQSSRLTPSPQPNNSTNSVNNSGSDTRSPSNRSTPDSRLRSPNTTFLPPPKNKPAAARHVKVLK